MPLLDWDKVMAAKPDSLSEWELMRFSECLVKYDPTENDVAKLQQLFKVAKAVITWQADEVEFIMKEMEKETKKMKKKEQELIAEIKTPKKKVPDPVKFGADKGPGTSRKIREEYLELEKENENLKQDLKDLRHDLNSERGTAEKYSQRISELEREKYNNELKLGVDKGPGTSRKLREEYIELAKENDNLKQDLKDLQQDLRDERNAAEKKFGTDKRRSSARAGREKDGKDSERIKALESEIKNLREINDQLRMDNSEYKIQLQSSMVRRSRANEKDFNRTLMLKEINVLLEENSELTAVNERLEKAFDILKQQYEEAILQMDKTTEVYAKLKRQS